MGHAVGALKEAKRSIDFTINGVPFTITGEEVPSSTSLNVFIRDHAKLRGTKAMCHEGGCGVCIVSAEINGTNLSVNSCLVPILICDGWSIKTIEGIGNRKIGYHSIQASLAEMNGSQCGYCSPGMVMNLYSLIQGRERTMKEIENSFGSNICRCTGYRPILDAFKSYATDAPPKLSKKIRDIEELYKCNKLCQRNKISIEAKLSKSVYVKLDDAEFFKIVSIKDLFTLFGEKTNASYILYGGNTAHGVYRTKKPDIYIDVNNIPDLRRIEKQKDSLILGGNVSLTLAKETFEKYSKEKGFEYLRHLAGHLDLVASVAVRNIGTIAGNLMIKHQHRDFPSDVFLMLETCGAEIHILEAPDKKSSVSLLEFLRIEMKRKLIYSIVLPSLSQQYEYRTYKIMPRAQNAHAHVNAGFLFKLDGGGKVLKKPNVIIGGINPDFLHATATEDYLVGKCILDKKDLKSALKKLQAELQPDHVLPDYSPEFRKTLAIGLFYKFVLSIKPGNLDGKLKSGATLLARPISSGSQDYDTDRSLWPLNKPIPKLESIYQTSGEGQYVNDLPPYPNQVFCAFVHSTVSNGKIESIDPKDALAMKGVVAFFTAKDVPGKNYFILGSNKAMLLDNNELLFAEERIEYAGQPIGVIVATTHALANSAVEKIKITYENVSKAILTIQDARSSKDESRISQTAHFPARTKGDHSKHEIKGSFSCGGQYHFTMEPQTCVCVPIEDGMDVYPASQYMDLIQISIAECLGVKHNSVNVNVRRLGGGYGSKISRATQIACAAALVCHKLNRVSRFVMSIESNMICVGKRPTTSQEYEIGVDENGLVQYFNTKIWSNAGITFNESHSAAAIHHMYSCYDNKTWSCDGYETKTDIPSNTFCRGPGSTEGIGMIEHLMEHVSRVVGKDSVSVRLINMNPIDKRVLEPMIQELIKSADFNQRKKTVDVYNKENRWKKKGISLVPMKYPLMYFGQFNAMVSIYARDGTVSVTHGGIECGQGIHTKVTQVAAHTLGIDLNLILVKPSNILTSPNNSVTGGSVTSESCAFATMMACKELIDRLQPIRDELKNPTWQELVFAAYSKNVDLCARYMFSSDRDKDVKPYPIYGVTIGEIELDILTGQHIVERIDLMEDVGVSMNPSLDLGQVEGAFVMGMGFWTSEDLIYNPDTGELTNHRTWNYKPPGAKDIPVDFRVTFRKNAPNPMGVLRSKATGEPPLCMSCVVPLAIRNAIDSARKDSGNDEPWYKLDPPLTTDNILTASLTNYKQMTLDI